MSDPKSLTDEPRPLMDRFLGVRRIGMTPEEYHAYREAVDRDVAAIMKLAGGMPSDDETEPPNSGKTKP